MNAWNPKSATWLGPPGLMLALAILASCALPFDAAAAPRRVEAFDAAAWPALQTGLTQPTVVVFSTTDCAHCPAVLRGLAWQIQQHRGKAKASLVAVVMDAAPGVDDAALISSAHYRPAARLLAFSGQAPALRFAVDPSWRGVTPFVVFLSPQLPPVFVTGPPTAVQVEAWLRAPAPAKPR